MCVLKPRKNKWKHWRPGITSYNGNKMVSPDIFTTTSQQRKESKEETVAVALVGFKKKTKRRGDAPHLISVDLMKDGVQHSFTTFPLLKTFEMKNSSVTPRNVIPPLRWLLKIR